MKDNELINKIKKDIKGLEHELTESSAQLGGVFYDSELTLKDSEIFNDLVQLEEKIPELKKQLDTLKNYNTTITASENKIKESNIKIKELESKIDSILEKIGVELYCFIGEKELEYPSLKTIYNELKEGEIKSEKLENKLYKHENNDVKRGFGDIILKPFKLHSIKREINQNNKDSLRKFRELGKVYTDVPELVNDESNESVLHILDEYKAIQKSIKVQKDNIKNLEYKISENERKILTDGKGLKLKTLYSKLEDEISLAQNQISQKLADLGVEIAERENLEGLNSEIQAKLSHYNFKKSELNKQHDVLVFLENRVKLKSLDQEISSRETSISIEQEHINSLTLKLEKERKALESLKEESKTMDQWLEEHHLDF